MQAISANKRLHSDPKSGAAFGASFKLGHAAFRAGEADRYGVV